MLNIPEAAEQDFSVIDGEIRYLPIPDKCISCRKVAAKMGDYMIVGRGARGLNPDGRAINTFGAHFVEVEVNEETGQVRVIKVVAAHDVGRVVNPLTATSQVYGGVLMGLGFATTEERVLDAKTGLQLTANLEDYKVPVATDVPEIDVVFVNLVDPEANSVGSKGLGEPPIIPAPAAIANAVADAIRGRIVDLPITPDRVLRALGEREEKAE
jgi:xanthine dehydrogenase YagR molybdenum-binding subunit